MAPQSKVYTNLLRRPSLKKKINNLAFGTSQERFGRFSLHPGLDRNGLFEPKQNGCDPALYKPISVNEVYRVNKNCDIVPWEYQTQLEDWARNLGYRNQKVLAYRAKQKAALGPAWHTLPEPIKCRGSTCKNIGFGTGRRFKTYPDLLPGPGTYYEEQPFRVSPGPHTLRPSFEWTPLCRFPDTQASWSVAVNRYRIIDKESIEQKPNKLVSRRGPYDLFTGPRDGQVRNHFSKSGRCTAATWPLGLDSSVGRLLRQNKGYMRETGRDRPSRGRLMLTDTSMCYKSPSAPGPATYTVVRPKVFRPLQYGFNSSVERWHTRAVVWPAVGRYSWKTDHRIDGRGHTYVFKSVVKRTIGCNLPKPYNSF